MTPVEPSLQRELLEHFAYEFGQTYDSYLAVEVDREQFRCRERHGFVSFTRQGHYAHVVGGLLAAPVDRRLLIAEFLEFCTAQGLYPIFYNVVRDELPLFRKHGFQITKWGEEPIVNLLRTSWRGSEYKWVRRQENYCLRNGLRCVEVVPDPRNPTYRDEILPQIGQLSHEHIAGTIHGKELGCFVSRFSTGHLGRRRMFVAMHDSRIEAYIVCNPCRGGTMWAMEMYRHRTDAIRGAVPFLMLQAMRLLQREGVQSVSLCLVPCLRCETPLPGDSRLYRWGSVYWWNRLNWVFDMRGVYHFKSRFRPEFRPRFIAAQRKFSISSGWSLIRVWGIVPVNPVRLLSRRYRNLKMRKVRATLAIPPTRSPSALATPPIARPSWYEGCIWLGIDFHGWMRLLARNRFRVHPAFWPRASLITIFSVVNTVLRGVQQLVFGRRVARLVLRDDPIFVIGHWRSGTTLLQKLLCCDPGNRSPTTYESLAPNHFLLTRACSRGLEFLLPRKRPMDNMAFGWEEPQEDEVALCNSGVPSPFASIAFPNQPLQYPEYLRLEHLGVRELRRWKTAFLRFLRQISYRQPGRIVLKSPWHSWRITVLNEMFPHSRFVHIVRDPHVVFPSTVHFWKTIYTGHALQRPNFDTLHDKVFDTYLSMHTSIAEARASIDPSRFYEIRYESLVDDPVPQLKKLWDALELGDFEAVLPQIRNHLVSIKDYRTNDYRLSNELYREIDRRWGRYLEKYGYDGTVGISLVPGTLNSR